MNKTVTDITPKLQRNLRKPRVAAYARVSCGKDTMLHSLEAQIYYYRNHICSNPDWEFAGIYTDEAKTGTKESREQFQQLLTDCRAGKIDIVITKSISRFARNTVTLLQTVRELKNLGINVFFEEQNIKTLDAEGEVMLTLLASFAQAESLSVSDNCKWRIRKGFEEGRASTCTMLGYRLVNGEITKVPEEAVIVKKIFDLYSDGFGQQKICNILNEEGIRTRRGYIWHPSAIRLILENEKYAGNLKLQKVFVRDHLLKKKVINHGELPIYWVENDHEPIISKEQFQAVQLRLKKQSEGCSAGKGVASVFTGKIHCAGCGKNYRRKTTPCRIVWCCATFNSRGKKYCPTSKMIPEETLKTVSAAALGLAEFDAEIFKEQIMYIDACSGNLLRFHFYDGSEKELIWKDRSRSESWTPEMRETARQKALSR